MATISHTRIDLIGAQDHRFALKSSRHQPQNGGRGRLVLERHLVGNIWVEVDGRTHDAFTKLSKKEQDRWAAAMEAELLEHWFSLEIARALD